MLASERVTCVIAKHKAEHAAFVRACDVFLDLAGRELVTGEAY